MRLELVITLGVTVIESTGRMGVCAAASNKGEIQTFWLQFRGAISSSTAYTSAGK